MNLVVKEERSVNQMPRQKPGNGCRPIATKVLRKKCRFLPVDRGVGWSCSRFLSHEVKKICMLFGGFSNPR